VAALHLIAFPPSRTDLLAQVASCMGPGDDLVLLEAGVLIAADATARAWFGDARCHVLEDDVATSGIQVPDGMTVIDWAALIMLSESRARSLSWWP